MDWTAKKADTNGQHCNRSRANGSLLVRPSILPERTKYKASPGQPIPCKAEKEFDGNHPSKTDAKDPKTIVI